MASTTRRLLLQSRQCPSRIRPRAAPKHTTTQWQRPLSTTPRRYANEPTKEGSATSANAKPPTETLNELSPELNFSNTTPTKDFKEMSQAERDTAMLDNLRASLAEIDPSVVADALRKGKRGLPQTQDFGLETDEDFEIEEDDKRKASMGFWAEGEESMGPDEDYYGDDLTSHGHGELQQHRELREYARLIAWELPLLSRTSLLLLNPYLILIKQPPRSRPTLHPTNISNPIPLPLYFLPWRITSRREQSRRRIFPLGPHPIILSNCPPNLQAHQASRPPLQPLHKYYQAFLRKIRHAAAKQAFPRRNHLFLDRRSQGFKGHVRRCAI